MTGWEVFWAAPPITVMVFLGLVAGVVAALFTVRWRFRR